MAKAIYFDMDGTIANLYATTDWLDKLRSYDPTPYAEAEALLNLQALAHRLNTLQKKGYKLGIVSWLSKESTPEYDTAVTVAKLAWLKKHLGSVKWDDIAIVAYGKKKSRQVKYKGGYLFDDTPKVRKEWIRHNPDGWAFDVNNILETLDLFE